MRGDLMKSIKMGREPSFISGIMGIVAALFGLFWTASVLSGGGGIFGLFGLIFVGIGILNAVRGFRNAFSKNRRSEFDIVDDFEEPDPWNERFGDSSFYSEKVYNPDNDSDGNAFCPYCGNAVERNFIYCNNCGKKLPD